jgi:tRNA (adenine57-N1/adenine58-N1)-methyltransferase
MYVLIDERGTRWLVKGDGSDKDFVVDKGKLVASIGKVLGIGGKRFLVLDASPLDLIDGMDRKAQIVLPKDSATVVFNCDIKPGDVVVEGGIGSGALTIALVHSVGSLGKVVSYELREDFAAIARKNLERTGLLDRVQIKMADITEGIEERDVDSVVLDLPEPWKVVEKAREALKPGGHFCSLSPNSSQVIRTVEELERYGYVDIFSFENLQRMMLVKDGWMRPDKMLAHTCYLTFARKTVEGFN